MKRALGRARAALARIGSAGLAVVAALVGGFAADAHSQQLDSRNAASICRAPPVASWPTNARARAALIKAHEQALPTCLGDAPFLAVLGALLLEDGQAEQAVLWLERSLLLDPANLGAQADFAIALAALGEPGPASALLLAWSDRADVPAALRQRLGVVTGQERFALPRVKLGRELTASSWGQQGEVSALIGREDNLERSPRLTELTLTLADGPLVLPVVSTPRGASATLLSASYQLAYAASPEAVLRSGVSASGRQAASEPGTNWRQYQWASSASYQRQRQRAQFDALVAWVEGPLGEPFRQTRLSLSGEQEAFGCWARLVTELEDRRLSRSFELDARYRGWAGGIQCDALTRHLGVSLLSRAGYDIPESAARPGGRQRVDSHALRVSAALPADLRAELTARWSRSDDATGYSPLLENNAVRSLRLRQIGVDFSLPLASHRTSALRGDLDLVLQVQRAKQTSNLALFGYRSTSAYTGLRWNW